MSSQLLLRIDKIVQETPRAQTFVLVPASGQPVSYEAGQFLTLILEHYGKPLRRSYSLGSTPGIDEKMFITIQRKTNGEISRFLLDTFHEGDLLNTLPPAGRFTFEPINTIKRNIFLLAGGSGIVPIYSLLKKIILKEPQSQVNILYSAPNEKDTIYYNHLTELTKKHSQLHIEFLFGNPEQGPRRRLNNFLLEELVSKNMKFNPSEALFYICGPTDYMRLISYVLGFLHFKPEQIRKEIFVVDAPLPTAFKLDASQPDRQVTIIFNGTEHLLWVPYYKNILQVALENGIELPYSCRGGRCSTCLGICTQGEVKMRINEVLTEKDLTQGYVLTCTAHPQSSHVVINMDKRL